jgi:hypothetical protein
MRSKLCGGAGNADQHDSCTKGESKIDGAASFAPSVPMQKQADC